jgi:beta-N-acetylhexosaminidase
MVIKGDIGAQPRKRPGRLIPHTIRAMERAARRRRRTAVGALACLAVLAFAFGLALGKGPGAKGERSGGTSDQEQGTADPLPPGQLAGARIIVGLSETTIPPELKQAIRHGDLAGVVLYAANFPSRAAGRRLIARLQAIPRPPGLRDPLLILLDQEGGLVKRVNGAPSVSAEVMGERGPAFSRREGRRTGRNLRDLGVNVDIAPVLDVARPGSPIALDYRGFGATAAKVTANGVAFAEGLQQAGVAATAKHFPGLGAATEDTDVEVGRIDLPKARLRRIDEAPYVAYARFGGDMVMVSTAIYPAFSDVPAAFSRPLVSGELRDRIGYEGVAMTDALNTAAVGAYGGPAKRGTAAARAGCDLLLYTELAPAEIARRALMRELRSGSLDTAEFEASAQRVLDLRAKLPR